MNDLLVLLVVGVLGVGAYWSMVLFPRQRDFAKRQRMARELAEGDEVVTFGGIIGKVRHIDAAMGVAVVEIADGVRVRVVTASLVQRYDPEEIAKNAQMGQANVVETVD